MALSNAQIKQAGFTREGGHFVDSSGNQFSYNEMINQINLDLAENNNSIAAANGSGAGAVGNFIASGDLAQQQFARGRVLQTQKTAGEIGYRSLQGDIVLEAMSNPQRILVNEEIRSFAAGLVTDISPLQEISNASIDEQNMLIIDDGSRARRRGLNYESSYTRVTSATHVNIQAYTWYHSNQGVPQIAVLFPNQANLSTSTMALNTFEVAADGKLGTADFTLSDTDIDYNLNRSFSEWGGDLYTPRSNYLGTGTTSGGSYYIEGGALILAERPVFIRDLWGVDDALGITERPNVLDANHLYNLINQGWSYADISAFDTTVGLFPSNADMPWFGKSADSFDVEVLKTIPSSGGAPKGSVVVSAQEMDRTASSLVVDGFASEGSLATSNIDTDDDQSLTWKFCTEYSGRIVWATQREATYARTASSNDEVPDMETLLFFSRTLAHQGKSVSATDPVADSADSSTAFSCYSTIDPASEFFESTLTDGGFFSLPEVGKIMGLKTIGNALLVIADNGVWAVSAGDVFDPINTVIRKLAGTGCESEKSIIVARDSLFYKGLDGVWSLQGSDAGVTSNKISEGRIDVWLSKHRGQFHDAVYDEVNQEIRWLVHKNIEPTATNWEDTGSELKQEELIYNIMSSTWTVNRFPNVTLSVSGTSTTGTTVTSGSYISAYVKLPAPVISGLPDRNEGSDTSEDVTRYTPVDLKRSTLSFKYIVVDSTGFTFADYLTDTYTDFTVTANEEMGAFLLTTYDNDSDSQRKKQVGHVTISFYRTELGVEDPGGGYVAANQGSCLLDYYWDHAQRTPTESSSRRKETYKLLEDYTISGAGDPYDYGRSVITTKNKIRGRGRSLQLEFHSSADKDLQILGWGITKKVNRRG